MACESFCIDNINMIDANEALGLAAYDKNSCRVVVQDSNAEEKNLEKSK